MGLYSAEQIESLCVVRDQIWVTPQTLIELPAQLHWDWPAGTALVEPAGRGFRVSQEGRRALREAGRTYRHSGESYVVPGYRYFEDAT